MVSWPQELPQEWFNDAGPTLDAVDNTIRSSNDAGPAKVRRRFTAQVENVSVSSVLCGEELGKLRCFVKTTLTETAKFAWKSFETGQPATYRFTHGWSSVKRQYFGGDLWTVTLEMEMLP